MTIQILPMEENDLDEIIKIEEEVFPDPWKKEDYLYEINDNPYAIYLKMIDKDSNTILGYMGFWITFEKAQITNVAIAKRFQGFHLSHLLLDDAERRMKLAECENSTLEVRVSNTRAISLYEHHGYKKVATRKNYYSNGEDAYLMLKEF